MCVPDWLPSICNLGKMARLQRMGAGELCVSSRADTDEFDDTGLLERFERWIDRRPSEPRALRELAGGERTTTYHQRSQKPNIRLCAEHDVEWRSQRVLGAPRSLHERSVVRTKSGLRTILLSGNTDNVAEQAVAARPISFPPETLGCCGDSSYAAR